jgi:hypothetical protein
MQEIIEVKQLNMLGRKMLADINPIFGNNLDKRSLTMDNDHRLMKERWFIEEIINDTDNPSGYLLNMPTEDMQKKLDSRIDLYLNTKTNILTGKVPGISNDFVLTDTYYVVISPDNKFVIITTEFSAEDNILLRTCI